MEHFIAELQRRKVLQAAGLYVALGWIGTEIISHLLDIFLDDPAPGERIVAIVFVAGFPVWVGLSWIFRRSESGSVIIDPWSPVGEFAILGGLVTVALVTWAMYWWLIAPKPAMPSYQAPHIVYESVAIAPFANLSGDQDWDYLADSLADQLFEQLLHTRNLRVVDPDDVKRIGLANGPGEPVEQLGAQTLLRGEITGQGQEVEVRLRLLDAAGRGELLNLFYVRTLTELPDLIPEVAQKLSMALGVKKHDVEVRPDSEPGNANAWSLYLRGRYEWKKRSREGLKAALDLFDQAVNVDPLYARAHVGMADTYMMLSAYAVAPAVLTYPLAIEKANEALRLDPSLGEAHAILGWAHCGYEWNWAAAERELLEAIRLSPGYASAYHWLAYCLWPQGRLEEAAAYFERAYQVDPLSPVIAAQRSFPLIMAGRIDEADKLIQLATREYPGLDPPRDMHGHLHMFSGDYQKALEYLIRWKNPGLVVMAQGLSGKRKEAEEGLRSLELRERIEYVRAIEMVFAYIGVGDTQKALEWLERSFEQHDIQMLWLNTSLFDSLRDEPRFQAVLAQMKFPE